MFTHWKIQKSTLLDSTGFAEAGILLAIGLLQTQ
jgi:hypothetical protein